MLSPLEVLVSTIMTEKKRHIDLKGRNETFYLQVGGNAFLSILCVQLEAHFGEGNGTPLQYSCLENPMDGGAW